MQTVLAEVRGRATPEAPPFVWWLLLGCGCTVSRPYRYRYHYRSATCPDHPTPIRPPRTRGPGPHEARMRTLCAACDAPEHGTCVQIGED